SGVGERGGGGGGGGGAVGVFGGGLGEDAGVGEGPEHAADVALHGIAEDHLSEGIDRLGQADEGGGVAFDRGTDEGGLRHGQRGAHADQCGLRSQHEGVAEEAVFARDQDGV